MKIAYLLEWEFDKIDGVIQKVLNQKDIWTKLGCEVVIFALSKSKDTIESKDVRNYHKSFKNLLFFTPLYRDLKSFNPDIVYFRYSAYKPYLNKIFKKYKTIIELNTDDIKEISSIKNSSIKNRVSYYNIVKTHRYMLSLSSGFVAVTEEIANSVVEKSKPKAVIPNSINLSEFTTKKIDKKNRQIPNLLFIGTPNQSWHGIDKIIHLAKVAKNRLNFYIVGESKPKDLNLKNIKFYGYMDKKEYKNIIINCDIGIGTLALHRKDMQEACPLKVREYLAYGLPTIIAYKDTALIDTKANWLLKLENDEDNIKRSIDEILEFCYKNIDTVVTEDEVKELIDSNILEQKRIEFMQRVAYGAV